MQGQPFRFDLGIVEHVVDDDQKRLGRGLDRVDVKTLLFCQGGIAQQVHHADHAVHGCADLVAHVGQERGLGPVRRLGPFARLFQFFLIADGFGDVQREADHVTALAALVDEFDIGVVPEPDHRGFGRRRLPSAQHHGAPFGGAVGADVDDSLIRQELQQVGIGDAGPDFFQPFEHREIGIVGRDHAVVQIEEGEAVLYRFDGMPEAAFSNLDLLMRLAQVGFDASVLILDCLDLCARLVDFVGQRLGMAAQLSVGREEFGLFQFQQAFRRQPGAPFISQFVGKAHAGPFDRVESGDHRRLPSRGRVNSG